MEISQVAIERRDRYIPLKGWDSVVAAVITFANGVSRGSRATTDQQTKALGKELGPLGGGYYVLVSSAVEQSHGNHFVNRLLEQAKNGVKHRGTWKHSYDYDGVGVFFKTSVEIGVLDASEDMYYLSLYAAYVGDQPEEGLAGNLDIPRGLMSCLVSVEVTPTDAEHFAFDFEAILRKLDNVLPVTAFQGESVVSTFKRNSEDRYGGEDLVFPLYRKGDIAVDLIPGRIQGRFQWDARPPKDTWSFEGHILRGRLAKSYERGKDRDMPTLLIRIFRFSEDRYERLPFYKPEEKELVLALTNSIAEALRA